jgi:Icc-related predicted phosphoesterase
VAIAELSANLPRVGGLGPTILVSHQPPHDTLCDVSRGAHVGSTTIRQFILDREPDLVLCGHIHESVGDDRLGASRVVNPGPWFAGNLLRMHASTNGIEILD